MKREKRGFTITELLLVIGILVILLGASVPGIVAIQRRLEQRQVDDYAREIFVAAQNQMSARAVAGTLNLVIEASAPDGELNWLTDNATVETLLEGDAMVILEADSHCMIKYNPDTATVLEVYYAREAMDTAAVITGVYSDENENNINRRKEAHIGYFRGDDAQTGKVAYMPTPLLTVDNDEELKVRVSVPSSTELSGSISYRVSLNVQELKVNGKPEAGRSFQTEPATSTGTLAFSYEETVILDSLAPDKHFFQISGGKVTPGANVMVTATVSYLSGGDSKLAYLASSASARTNSLFAGLDNGGAARIANGRHLQNLSAGVSKVSGISTAVQTEIVNWTLHENGTQDYYALEYPEAYSNASPLYFQPITNPQLSSYDGKNNEIQCLDISLSSGTAANAGLFATMSGGAQLKNIAILCPSISNPSLSNSNTVSTGALAGYLNRATVTNCRCYGANGFVFGNSKFVGGLIGRADNCLIINSFAQLFRVESDCGKTVGGLIGSASGGKAEYCYANTGVLYVNQSNGLNEWVANYGLRSAGKTAGGTVYSLGIVGGLIGYGAGSLEINNCYSCGFAGEGAAASGILGKDSGIEKALTNSYSVLSYGSGVSAAYGISEHNTYYDDNSAYWLGGRSAGLTITGKNGYVASSLLARPGNWISAGVSYPYGGTLSATSAVYPYPMINNLPHYGDWPPPEAVPTKTYIFSGLTSAGSEAYTPYKVNNNNYYVTLEQIPGTGNFNQKTITAYAVLNVNGTESTPHAVVWQLYTGSGADDGWTTITGSSINITSGGKVRATLHRNSSDNTYAGNNTGGSIALTAIDVDEFTTAVDIALRVRSVLSVDANEWARVNVKIMPQLQFVDSAISVSTVYGSGDVSVIANRKKNDVVDGSYSWTPQWQIVKNTDPPTSSGGVAGNTDIRYNQHYTWNSNDFYFVTLMWGPYSCSGTITTREFAGGLVSSCTGDALLSIDSNGNGSYYFIIEKGSQRSFSFSWTSTDLFGRTPDLTNNIGSLGSNVVNFSSPPVLDDGASGSQTYVVTGENYNDSIPLQAWWKAQRVTSTTSHCDIYVVGLESDEVDKITAKTTDRGGSPVSFKVKAHFPDGILSDKARTYTWWADDNEYIGVVADANPAGESAHTTVLKANTSGEDVKVNVYCRYAVSDTRFTYTQLFTVTIPSMTPPAFEKCVVEDLVFMPGIAAEGAQASWIDPVISGTDCQLVAGSSIYIRTADAYIRNGTEQANYTYYDVELSESSEDITIERFVGSDKISYFRIDTVAEPAANTATAAVTVGPWTGTLNFNIVRPSVTIGGAYTLDEGGQQVPLTANGEGFYECTAGTDMHLQLSGVPDLSGLEVSGLEDGKLTATVPALDYTNGSYSLCLTAAAVTEQSDLTLTIKSARYPAGVAVKIRIVPATAPEPAPAPAPPVLSAAAPQQTPTESAAPKTTPTVSAAPETTPTESATPETTSES